MAASFFYLQTDKNDRNHIFLDSLEEMSARDKLQVYVVDRPLGDSKYSYGYESAMVVMAPKHKIMFVDFADDASGFESFCEDFIEDLGSISDKYRYKEHIGRPRAWKDSLIHKAKINEITSVETLFTENALADASSQRRCEL
ncbi:hypothetical protein, partial [Xanthomonas translucens]